MSIKARCYLAGFTLAATGLFVGGVGTAHAEDYTGCVTPGGTIIHLALGQSPAKPCKGKLHIIHLDDTNANQHVSAQINLPELCKVLHLLGASGTDYKELGCHSDPTLAPPGEVQLVRAPTLLGGGIDSFDENNETCNGMLKIKNDAARWGAANYHWELTGENKRGQPGGAMVARTLKLLQDGTQGGINGVCATACKNDPQCIAAFLDDHLSVNLDAGVERDCRIFHYSDSPQVNHWNEYCASAGEAFCKQEIGTGAHQWYLRATCDVPNPPTP